MLTVSVNRPRLRILTKNIPDRAEALKDQNVAPAAARLLKKIDAEAAKKAGVEQLQYP